VELLRGDLLDVSEELLETFRSLPVRKRVVFQEERTELDLAPADLGVGISQIIPILASGVRPTSITAIEQPELHLHPAQQVELGDFFIAASSAAGRSPEDLVSASDFYEWAIFIVETHSEHLILRLLRRDQGDRSGRASA
jgi:predicted ATPase